MKKRFKNIGHILLCSVIISAILLSGVELSNLSLVTKADSTNLVEFTKCKYRSLSGDSHISVKKEGEDEVLTFSRNYASANTWSGGGIQLRTDDGEYYKLKPSTSYQVKFDYRVESYSEASDAEFKDLSLMVAVSKNDEGTFTNARSVASRDLDAVTFAHKANESATKGDYAAVGARIKAEEVDNNWHSVTAVFTTKETLEISSGTYDNLTLSIISNKTNAGDIKVSFKNMSAEQINLSSTFNNLRYRSLSGDSHVSVGKDGTDKILTFSRNYASANTWSGGGIQIRTDDGEYYKLKPSTSYQVKFDYRVESYSEASDAEFKDLSLMVAVSKNDEGTFTNARSVASRDLDAVTFAHKANESATKGDYAAVGARIKAEEVDNNWHSVTAVFTTKETLEISSGTYDNLTLSIISNKTNAGDIKVSFKNISAEQINLSSTFNNLKYRSLSGDSHVSVGKDGTDKILTFSRNYASANTWSGGGIQLRTDDGEYYKLKPSTSYQVKFDYRVESYSEASDAEYKDLSLMVAVSKNDEGTFTNARSVTSRDLDAVTFAHKANEPATSGDYAAVGARIKAEEVDNNWHSVTAVFTTKETLEISSGTYDNLTLSIISNKTNAGDIKVSFKNISAEKLNPSISFNELKHHSLSGDDYLSVVQEGTDKILTFNRNYTDEEANELWAGDGIQLKTDNNEFYKLKPLSTYRIKFDYRVESYNEADDAQFKDLSLMVAVSKNDEDWFTNARSVTARDLDAVTFAHKANEPATSGDYAAVGAKIKAGEVDSAWHSVTAEFTTKETLTTGSGTYDNLTLSIISNKIKAGNMKISFKKISVEVLNEPEPDIEPTHDPIYFFNAITAGAVKYKYGATEQEDYIELSKNSSDNAMAFQYKTDKDTFYKVKQYIGYRVSFSYRVPDYTEYRNNGKMYITIGGTMNGETAWWETRNIISNDRGQMSVSIKDGKKYPGIEVSGHTNDWKQANVTFDIYNPIANIKDPNKVYENLTFLILSGDPNGSGRSKTTVQIKNIKISQVELDNGERTIEFVTNGGKKVNPMNVNVADFENMVLPTTTRDKFIFTGWYFDELCTKPFNIDDCVADGTGRIVLYAGWKALETGLNFQFTTVKKAQTIYETISEEDNNIGIQDSNTTKVIKKRKKLIRTINDDSDGFSVAKVIVLISVIAVFVIAGGLTLFFVIKKKKFHIGK